MKKLDLHVTNDPAKNCSQKQFQTRDLRIDFSEEKGRVWVDLHGGPFSLLHEMNRINLSNSLEQLRKQVEGFREFWKTTILDRKVVEDGKSWYPWMEAWDHSHPGSEVDPKYDKVGNELNAICQDLADKGAIFFEKLFEGDAPETFLKFKNFLATNSKLKIAVMDLNTSIPWPMIYVHPADKEAANSAVGKGSKKTARPKGPCKWVPEGFWGIQHEIDQNPARKYVETRIGLDGLKLKISMYVHSDFSNCKILNRSYASLEEAGAKVIPNLKRRDFQRALSRKRTQAQINYFLCHGSDPDQNEHGIKLDDFVIRAAEISVWHTRGKFVCRPLFFLNCCRGALLLVGGTNSVALELLKRQAVSVIGPHILVPKGFASEYGTEFIELLVKGHRPSEIAKNLARKFLTQHRNPLGLVYATFRGMDVRCTIPMLENKGTFNGESASPPRNRPR